MLTISLFSHSIRARSSQCQRRRFHNACLSIALPMLICGATASLQGQIGNNFTDKSPTIDTDVSSLIATGGGYDAWTGSARRHVVDFEVSGAIPGLKWE